MVDDMDKVREFLDRLPEPPRTGTELDRYLETVRKRLFPGLESGAYARREEIHFEPVEDEGTDLPVVEFVKGSDVIDIKAEVIGESDEVDFEIIAVDKDEDVFVVEPLEVKKKKKAIKKGGKKKKAKKTGVEGHKKKKKKGSSEKESAAGKKSRKSKKARKVMPAKKVESDEKKVKKVRKKDASTEEPDEKGVDIKEEPIAVEAQTGEETTPVEEQPAEETSVEESGSDETAVPEPEDITRPASEAGDVSEEGEKEETVEEEVEKAAEELFDM